MSTPEILALVKQGDPAAIAHCLNQALQAQGVTAKATRRDRCLRLLLEAEQVPQQQVLVAYLQKAFTKLGIQAIETVELYGKQACAAVPAWRTQFQLEPSPVQPAPVLLKPTQATAVPPRPAHPAQSRQRLVATNSTQQRFFAAIAALGLVLVGANLRSLTTLLSSAKTRETTVLNRKQPGVYQAPIIQRLHSTPVIDVVFNGGQTYPMIVDTGASATLITPTMAANLGVVTVGRVRAGTANGSVTLNAGYVDSIEVDGAKIERVPVAVGLPDTPYGLLGHDFFGNYDVTVRENVVEFRSRDASLAQ